MRTRTNSSFIFSCAGLHCCVQAFSNCVEQRLLFIAVHTLLIAGASGAAACELNSCSVRALECLGVSGCSIRA